MSTINVTDVGVGDLQRVTKVLHQFLKSDPSKLDKRIVLIVRDHGLLLVATLTETFGGRLMDEEVEAIGDLESACVGIDTHVAL